MTVAQLIAELKKIDKTLTVQVNDSENGHSDVGSVADLPTVTWDSDLHKYVPDGGRVVVISP